MKKFLILHWQGAEKYFLKTLRQTFLICLGIFIATIIVNVIIFQSNPQLAELYYQELVAVFKNKAMMDYSGVNLWLWIFFNNLIAGGITVISGFIPFLFLPLLSLISNAMIIGLLGAVYQLNDVGWVPFLAGILPHGMLEIPALILVVTLGVHLCFVLIKTLTRRNFKGELKQAVIASLRIFCLWVIPLFLLAAFIETFATPIIFNAFFKG
jgi:stage II sporulation protein M